MRKALLSFVCVFLFIASAQTQTIIVDDLHDGFSITGSWTQTSDSSQRHASTYYETNSSFPQTAAALWSPDFPSTGSYTVDIWYTDGVDRVSQALYMVGYPGGSETFMIDQRTSGGQWVNLGSFFFNAGTSGGGVALSNVSFPLGQKVIADAVRFVGQGTSYPQSYQAMWIYCWGTDYGFYNESQTSATLQIARQNHVNAIFPEVRARGSAYYISATEPRADNIDPGYLDPLGDIITKAHDTSDGKQHIEVHAWIIPYVVWYTSEGSPPPDHVLAEHPDWIMSDYWGNTSDLDGRQCIDPGVPGVVDYLVDVVLEIVQNYDVDGIHFDYFRYLDGQTWGYNPVSVARFNQLYGTSGTPAYNDPDWCDFRRAQIKALGRKAYAKVKQLRWDVKMSAATITWGSYPGDFTATRAYYEVFQDWPAMMSEGMLDLNCPMNYKQEHIPVWAAAFRSWTQFTASTKAGRHAIIGTGNWLNYMHNSGTQMNYARDYPGIDGNNIYRYGYSSFEGPSYEDISWQTIRADTYDQRRNIPESSWLTSPTFGILCGTVSDLASQPLDGATVSLSSGVSGTQETDGTGFYAFLQLPPGSGYLATASYNGDVSMQSFDIVAGSVTTLDFTLPPTGVPDWDGY